MNCKTYRKLINLLLLYSSNNRAESYTIMNFIKGQKTWSISEGNVEKNSTSSEKIVCNIESWNNGKALDNIRFAAGRENSQIKH